jgi:hypothetical protein
MALGTSGTEYLLSIGLARTCEFSAVVGIYQKKDCSLGSYLIMEQTCKFRSPQGLKPHSYAALDGAAEAAPFQNRFIR